MGFFDLFKKNDDTPSPKDLTNAMLFLRTCLCVSQIDGIFTTDYKYSSRDKEFFISMILKEAYKIMPNYKKILDTIIIVKNETNHINSGIVLLISQTTTILREMKEIIKDDIIDRSLVLFYENLENGYIEENIYNTIPALRYAYDNNSFIADNSYFLKCANFIKEYHSIMNASEAKMSITQPNITSYILGYCNVKHEQLYFKYIYELYAYCNIDIRLAVIAYFRLSLLKYSEWDETSDPYGEGKSDREHGIFSPSRINKYFEGTESPYQN